MTDLLNRLGRYLERRRREHQTRSELSQLTDRELSDLGISRTDIGQLARESAEGAIDLHAWRERRGSSDGFATGQAYAA